MQVTWRASQSASCFHAAVAALEGHALIDMQLAAAIDEPRERLCEETELSQLSPAKILSGMYALTAAGIEGDRLLVERALARQGGGKKASETTLQRLTGRVRDLEVAYRNYHAARSETPFVEELALRGQPLREQWQAYGPGLLHQIGRLTEPELIVEATEVVLVQPAIGGHGVAHLGNNRVTFEAVLANPVTDLPEVARLAWLLAQLQMDLPRYGERIARDRLSSLAMHALLPPALAAAQEIEIVSANADLMLSALDAWLVGNPDSRKDRAAVLVDWWSAYESNPPDWPVAIEALDALLSPGTDVDDSPPAVDDPA